MAKQAEAKTKLDEPQLVYQNYLQALEAWRARTEKIASSLDA